MDVREANLQTLCFLFLMSFWEKAIKKKYFLPQVFAIFLLIEWKIETRWSYARKSCFPSSSFVETIA